MNVQLNGVVGKSKNIVLVYTKNIFNKTKIPSFCVRVSKLYFTPGNS